MVGRRVEIVGHAAVRSGDAQKRVPLVDRVAAERNQLLDSRRSPGSVGAETLSGSCEKLVVGAADLEVQNLELTAALDDGIEDGVEELRVDQVAFRPDDDRVQWSFGHDRKQDYSVRAAGHEWDRGACRG